MNDRPATLRWRRAASLEHWRFERVLPAEDHKDSCRADRPDRYDFGFHPDRRGAAPRMRDTDWRLDRVCEIRSALPWGSVNTSGYELPPSDYARNKPD